MTDKIEELKTPAASETPKAPEPEIKATDAPKARKARAEDDAPKARVLKRNAFINGRLYEAGETVYEDEAGTPRAVAKSTPAGDLSVDQLKQLLAEAQVREKTAAAKGE